MSWSRNCHPRLPTYKSSAHVQDLLGQRQGTPASVQTNLIGTNTREVHALVLMIIVKVHKFSSEYYSLFGLNYLLLPCFVPLPYFVQLP
jgi:hypothetical protein